MGGLLLGYRSHTLGFRPADLEYDDGNARTPPSSPCETQDSTMSPPTLQQSIPPEQRRFDDRPSACSAPHDQQQQCEASTSKLNPTSRTLPDNTLDTVYYRYQTPQSDMYSSYTASPCYPPQKRRHSSPVAVRSSERLPLLSSDNLAYTTSPDPQYSTYQNSRFPPRAILTHAFPPYHLQMAHYVPCLSSNAARAQDLARYGLQRLQD
jgi:hypothetical protein